MEATHACVFVIMLGGLRESIWVLSNMSLIMLPDYTLKFSRVSTRAEYRHRFIGPCRLQINRCKCVFCNLIDALVDCHFMIRIISLATVSFPWLGSLDNFPPMCIEAYLMVLNDCLIICINLSSSVVDKYTLFMELMRLSKFSYLFSWRWTFIVDVLFDWYFLPLPFLSYLHPHCATLT